MHEHKCTIQSCQHSFTSLSYYLSMRPKTRSLPKAKSLPKAIDPFDGLDRPAMKSMGDMMKWHHRVPPDQLPMFLREYQVLHFIGAETAHKASDTVYELYHCIFDSHSDRMSLSVCLQKGEMLTIWKKEEPKSISAITFVQCKSSVLVLFLAAAVDYQATGMATFFLLSIMHQIVKCKVGCDDVNVFLKGNPTNNQMSWSYYLGCKCDFTPMDEHPKAFPQVLRDCFSNEAENSPLKDYLGFRKDLKWLTTRLTH
jgi:hypothetical protein